MAITTYEEEVQLRILTGREVGKLIGRMGISKLAAVSVSNLICNVLSSSAIAAFTERGGVAYNFIVEPDKNDREIAERVAKFNPDAILLLYGGELPVEDLKRSLKSFLRALAETNLKAKLFFHVRAFLAGAVEHSLKDEVVRRYLEENELYVYTADLDRGIMLMNKINVDGEKLNLIPMLYSSLSFEHTSLLNRSLAGRD
ncbi:MAG: hypothetical protein QW437_06410, partial [Fervidicoccaceae archaeon]